VLSDADIQRALHAARVVPLEVSNPNGPLGLEWLAGAVALARGEEIPQRVQRPIALSLETWEKLSRMAQNAACGRAQPPTPSELAASLLDQFVAMTNQQ